MQQLDATQQSVSTETCVGAFEEGSTTGLFGRQPCPPSGRNAAIGVDIDQLHPLLGDARFANPVATLVLDARKGSAIEASKFRPIYSIVMAVHNGAVALAASLPPLLALSTGVGELLVMMDLCTDGTFATIKHTLGDSHGPRSFAQSPGVQRVRVWNHVFASLFEAAAENMLMAASEPTSWYISVQPDMVTLEFGWNAELARPAEVYSDVFAVSGSCAHAFGAMQDTNSRTFREAIKARYERSGNRTFNHWSAGRCTQKSARPATPRSKSSHLAIDKATRATNNETMMLNAAKRMFHVRETANRGPLLLHAERARAVRFFDSDNVSNARTVFHILTSLGVRLCAQVARSLLTQQPATLSNLAAGSFTLRTPTTTSSAVCDLLPRRSGGLSATTR